MGTTYYFLPTRNLFGEGAVKEVGSLMESLGWQKGYDRNRRLFGKKRYGD